MCVSLYFCHAYVFNIIKTKKDNFIIIENSFN